MLLEYITFLEFCYNLCPWHLLHFNKNLVKHFRRKMCDVFQDHYLVNCSRDISAKSYY